MRILGIDPSLSCTGWAIVEDEKVVKAGTIKTNPKDGSLIERLSSIKISIDLKKHVWEEPDYIAIEDVFVNRRNMKTSITLAKVHGLILCAFMLCVQGGHIKVYAPTFVKQTITGNGNASKEQVLKMVQLQSGYKGKQLDESDAIAVALTCFRDLAAGPNKLKGE